MVTSLHILILDLLYHHHLVEALPVPVVLHLHLQLNLVVVVVVLPGAGDQ